MNLATTIELHAYGTSEGVSKAWDTRGRGRKAKPAEVVRNATQQDIDSMKQDFNAKKGDSAPELAESLLLWIGDSEQPENTLIARDEKGQLNGALLWGRTNFKGKQYFEVNALAVHPDILTGKRDVKGTGTKLMIAAAKLAAKENLGVELVASSVGRGFYEKIGMHEAGEAGRKSGIFIWSKEEARSFGQHG